MIPIIMPLLLEIFEIHVSCMVITVAKVTPTVAKVAITDVDED